MIHCGGMPFEYEFAMAPFTNQIAVRTFSG